MSLELGKDHFMEFNNDIINFGFVFHKRNPTHSSTVINKQDIIRKNRISSIRSGSPNIRVFKHKRFTRAN